MKIGPRFATTYRRSSAGFIRSAIPPTSDSARIAGAAQPRARAYAPAYAWPSPGKSSERNAAANALRPRADGCSGDGIAGTIPKPLFTRCEADVRTRHHEARPRCPGARDSRAVARAPDLRAAASTERGRGPLELPRRAHHGQQPDGRPSRVGPDVQGRLPAVPRHARRGAALAERVRLPGAVGRGQRREGPRLHE